MATLNLAASPAAPANPEKYLVTRKYFTCHIGDEKYFYSAPARSEVGVCQQQEGMKRVIFNILSEEKSGKGKLFQSSKSRGLFGNS